MLEIIGFDYQGCIDAQTAGADRIELCADPHLGGTTPTKEMIESVMRSIDIPVNVMIRPRGGDFTYSTSEHREMLRSIEICKSYNCAGVVFGVLTTEGRLQKDRLQDLISASAGMDMTFHRAFDVCTDPYEMIENLINFEVPRILTSGQGDTAVLGSLLLVELKDKYGSDIIIMPGAGVTSSTLPKLDELINAADYHSSAKRVDSKGNYLGVNQEEVMAMKAYLKSKNNDS